MSTPPPPRVLFITTDYPPEPGGLQTYSLKIARELPGGLLARVLTGSDRVAGSLPPPRHAAFEVHRGRGRLRAALWSLRRIFALRLSGKTDCILHMQWSTAPASWLLRKVGLGLPYVVLIHGAELIDPGRPWLNRLKAAVLARADAVVAGSRATADLFLRLGLRSRRLEVIPYGNPLPTRPAAKSNAANAADSADAAAPEAVPSPEREPRPAKLLCMHRLVARKGTALLLAALGRLRDLPWTLDVAGRGEEEPALRRLCEELGLSSRVAFLGAVAEPEKPALLDGADLFVLPSLPPRENNHMEGLGLALLEAQGRGLPVLAARTGGIPEAVAEGRTGLLFAAGDKSDLEAKLRLLLGDAALRRRLGEAGPGWVRENFAWDRSLARLAGLLEEVAGEGSGGIGRK
jgi:phosphatidylinositol alpha-1,6-mannosyltransferase